MKRRGASVLDQTAAVVIQGAFGQRAEPPPELTPRQQEIWRLIVASEPTEFFATAMLRNLLMDLCRHREAGEKITTIIDAFDPSWLCNGEGVERYNKLMAIRDREVRAALSLATKLRLTNQSRYQPKAASVAARSTIKGSKPWDKAGGAS